MHLKSIIEECRPHQYLKNGFVLVGPMFSEHWSLDLLMRTLLAFLAFSATASAVYCVNDILDVESDRKHPTKCHRPIAKGTLSIRGAWTLAIILVGIGFALAIAVSSWAVVFIFCYIVINLCYSFICKHIPVLDVFLISAGFMMRLLTGTLGLNVTTSHWILLCGLMLTLFLGFAKRYSELKTIVPHNIKVQSSSRKVLNDYNLEMVSQLMTISAACTIISYSLYTISSETISKHHTYYLIITVPIFVYGIFRYIFILHSHNGGQDTARDILHDKHMLVVGTMWLMITILVLINA